MRVVVVGGGVGGHLVCHALQGQHEVVLVEPRDHLAIPLAAPRTMVNPSFSEGALIPYAEFLPGVTHVRAKASRVDAQGVQVRGHTGEERVEGDIIVLATGSRYVGDNALLPPTPRRADRLDEQRQLAERIAAARRVLIVGGGPVGVEVAGEILHSKPDTLLTLVHAGPKLLPGTSAKVAEHAAEWLESRGANLILNDRVDRFDTTLGTAFSGTTHNGVPVEADLRLSFVGYRPNLSYLHLANAVGAGGRVRVLPTLQVAGHPTVFAVGDITDLDERKLAMYAAKHAKVVIKNIRRLAAGAAPNATYTAKSRDQTMLVTLGPDAGVGHLPFGAFRSPWLARTLKSGDMMVGKYRRRIGLVPLG